MPGGPHNNKYLFSCKNILYACNHSPGKTVKVRHLCLVELGQYSKKNRWLCRGGKCTSYTSK